MNSFTKDEQETQETPVVVRKKKFSKKIISVAIAAVIVLAILTSVFISGYSAAKNRLKAQLSDANETAQYWKQQYEDLLKVPVVLEPVTPEIVQKVLSSKTEEISELATAEYLFTNAARFTDSAHIVKVFDWMTKKSFIQKWDGRIKAGVKLDELQISVKDTVITITMPYAEILSYEIDYDSIEVLDEKNNIFNPISVNDKANFDKETKDAMIERAKSNGLLEKAQENAKATIANLLTASVDNIQDYTIEFNTVGN